MVGYMVVGFKVRLVIFKVLRVFTITNLSIFSFDLLKCDLI